MRVIVTVRPRRHPQARRHWFKHLEDQRTACGKVIVRGGEWRDAGDVTCAGCLAILGCDVLIAADCPICGDVGRLHMGPHAPFECSFCYSTGRQMHFSSAP